MTLRPLPPELGGLRTPHGSSWVPPCLQLLRAPCLWRTVPGSSRPGGGGRIGHDGGHRGINRPMGRSPWPTQGTPRAGGGGCTGPWARLGSGQAAGRRAALGSGPLPSGPTGSHAPRGPRPGASAVLPCARATASTSLPLADARGRCASARPAHVPGLALPERSLPSSALRSALPTGPLCSELSPFTVLPQWTRDKGQRPESLLTGRPLPGPVPGPRPPCPRSPGPEICSLLDSPLPASPLPPPPRSKGRWLRGHSVRRPVSRAPGKHPDPREREGP